MPHPPRTPFKKPDIIGWLKQIQIDTIYIQNSFTKDEIDRAVKTIRDVWEEEGVTKHINLSKIDQDPKRIILFDPTIKTNCSYECHQNGSIGYFPDEYCKKDNTNQIAITSFIFLGGCGQTIPYGKRVWVESYFGTDTNAGKNRGAIKHELGHMLGAPHPFEISVSSGRTATGQFHSGVDHSMDKDVMNYNEDDLVGEYSRYIIDKSLDGAQKNQYERGFHARSVQLTSEDEIDFSKSTFYLYGGTRAESLSKKGVIIPDPACYFSPDDPRKPNYPPQSTITLQNNIPSPEGIISNLDVCFFQFPYVAGFIELSYNGSIYHGSFDLVDLGLAVKKGERYPKVKLLKQ